MLANANILIQISGTSWKIKKILIINVIGKLFQRCCDWSAEIFVVLIFAELLLWFKHAIKLSSREFKFAGFQK